MMLKSVSSSIPETREVVYKAAIKLQGKPDAFSKAKAAFLDALDQFNKDLHTARQNADAFYYDETSHTFKNVHWRDQIDAQTIPERPFEKWRDTHRTYLFKELAKVLCTDSKEQEQVVAFFKYKGMDQSSLLKVLSKIENGSMLSADQKEAKKQA